MPCETKQVINPDTYEVVVLENKYHAIAKTFSDRLVGYYLDGSGNLRATHSHGAEYEYDSWLAFRTWAGNNLPNPVLERGGNFVVKKVSDPKPAGVQTPPKTASGPRPAWLSESAAAPHARKLDSHEADD